MMDLPDYSVLMSVYKSDIAEYFQISMDAMLQQTHKPSEIVLVQDGPINEQLRAMIEQYCENNPTLIKKYVFEENQGLGKVLAFGVEKCSNDYIARMDADDYCRPERCQKELEYMVSHPEIDCVGTNVEEFYGDISNIVAHVILPKSHEQIWKYAKKRNPIRHPSLLYKKEAVLRSGNYRHLRFSQDYSLIVDLMQAGCKTYNIQEPLTFMRVTQDFYKRRSGSKYFKINYALNKSFLNQGFFSYFDFIKRTSAQFVSCYMPNFMRQYIYNHLLRKE